MAKNENASLSKLGRLLASPSFWLVLGAIVFLKSVCYMAYHAHYGVTTDDEGFYCLISREAAAGRVLYHDLFYTQMPLLPYIYGPLLKGMPASIESGRWISCAFTLIGLMAMWRTVRVWFSPAASFAGLALIATDASVYSQGCVVLSEPLAFACTALGLWALTAVVISGRRKNGLVNVCAALAGIALACAALTRLSMLPIMLVVLAFLVLAASRRRERVAWTSAIAFGVASLGAFAIVSLCFALRDWPRFLFGVYSWNAIFAEQYTYRQSIPMFFRTLGETSLVSSLVAVGVMAGAFSQWKSSRAWRDSRRLPFEFACALEVAWLICTILHATRRPAFGVYQFPILPLLAFVTAWVFDQWRIVFRRARLACPVVLVLAGGLWLVWPMALVDVPVTETAAGVYQAASPLREAGAIRLLTVDSNLAYCAPRARIIHGYEMADFSLMGDYIPPAERSLGGRTPEQFFDDIGRADYVALRESDLNWFPPRMRPALVAKLNSLEPVSVTHHFGQFGGEGMQSDDLIIVRRRSMPREILRR